MLKVWGRRSSFNVQKVMWLVGELGLAHRHIDAGGGFGGLDAPEFLAMNPHGRIPVIRAALARCATDFGKLDRLLEGRSFLLGDALTLADITAGTSLYRYFELEIERPPLPQVERWYRTLQGRAAFRDHVMIPFDELRGRLDY
jgi:glutathione S-transferase